jgi:hypothetical protein
MKTRRLWTLVTFVIAAVLALALWSMRRHDATPPQATTPAGKTAPGGKATSVVPIEDRKTIDFSSGTPVVKDSAQEKAIIDRAAKEMEEAAKDVSFSPPETTEPTKAEPTKPAPNPPP